MEKNVEISVLCQLYGKLLTEKQYEVLTDYYNNDLSLSEIAENNNITRQAVRDIIKKGENKLYELEAKISLMKKAFEQEKIINQIEKELDEIKKLTDSNNEVANRINNIKKELRKLNWCFWGTPSKGRTKKEESKWHLRDYLQNYKILQEN